MHEIYNINNASSDGSKGLANIYNIEQLKDINQKLIDLDKANINAFNSISSNNDSSLSELTDVFKTKINSLREIVEDAIKINEFQIKHQKGSLMLVPHNKTNIAITEHLIVQQQDLKSVEKEIDLGTSINTDKQFFYNCRQENMEVSNELSFEIDMMFEPLAAIPLRLQYNTKSLNREISFEVNFF